jgi:hypothetical protein
MELKEKDNKVLNLEKRLEYLEARALEDIADPQVDKNKKMIVHLTEACAYMNYKINKF